MELRTDRLKFYLTEKTIRKSSTQYNRQKKIKNLHEKKKKDGFVFSDVNYECLPADQGRYLRLPGNLASS